MSKILVGELRGYVKEFLPSEVKVITVGDMDIDVKQYTSILDKIEFATLVHSNSVEEDDGVYKHLQHLSDIGYKRAVINRYTNITLPKDAIDSYDLITNSGLYDIIYNAIPELERLELERIVRNYFSDSLDIYERENQIGNVVKNVLNDLMQLIPSEEDQVELVNKIAKEIDGFDKDTLEFIPNALKVLQGENDGASK